jgi:uncharacterized membrane protein
LFVLVTALLIPISATAQYIATELPPLPGDSRSRASGINAAGEVFGVSDRTAVVWDRAGNPSALPTPPDCNIWRTGAINSSGVTIGSVICDYLPRRPRVVVWDRFGNPTFLPLTLGSDVFASDVNASGLIVGGETDRSTRLTIAVLWDRDGNPVELPRVDSYQIGSGAYGINNAGKIVGYADIQIVGSLNYRYPVVWDRFGNPTFLCGQGAPRNAIAVSISERGEVAGTFWPPRYPAPAFVSDRDGNCRALPPLPGDDFSYLTGRKIINVRGEVVGFSWAYGGQRTATVWDSDGNPTALPCLGPYGCVAAGINAAGEVVGYNVGTNAVVWRPDRREAP